MDSYVCTIRKKQQILIEQLHNENLKLAWSQNSSEIQEIYGLMKLYDSKLAGLKRNMKILHEKIIKLKVVKMTSKLRFLNVSILEKD